MNDTKKICSLFCHPCCKKVVLLPSSYNEHADLAELIRTNPEKYIVYCRERQSLQYIQSISATAETHLANDMVIDANFYYYISAPSPEKAPEINQQQSAMCRAAYTLYGEKRTAAWKQIRQIANASVLYALRVDRESQGRQIPENNFDVSALIPLNMATDKALNHILTRLFLTILDYFSVVVTDRLHIAICATKLNKKVYFLDNSYKKNSSVYAYSLSKFPNIELVADIPQLAEEQKAYRQKTFSFYDLPASYEDFKKLYLQF